MQEQDGGSIAGLLWGILMDQHVTERFAEWTAMGDPRWQVYDRTIESRNHRLQVTASQVPGWSKH